MKYMGSKAKIAKELLPILIRDRKPNQHYVEPFAGGMNMICEVDGLRIAADSNPYLIEMWKSIIADGWVPPENITKTEYGDIKNNKDKYPQHLVGWVGFNCSYSGKWFGGFAGQTKTQINAIRDYQKEAIKNIEKQKSKLNGVEFICETYDKLKIPDNSIIYCDPPYANTTKYYTDFDHDKFWDWVCQMGGLGHEIYVSEYDIPEKYKNRFVIVWQKTINSSLSANGKFGGSKESVEKLFKHGIPK